MEIEKNIPIPAKQVGNASKYNWQAMEVGDSFFLPVSHADRKALKSRVGVAGAGNAWAKRHKVAARFIGRPVNEPGKGEGVRIWRES